MEHFDASGTMSDILKNVPLLAKLSDADRVKLAEKLVSKSFSNGQSIITQNDPGSEFFIIKKGGVVVTRRKDLDDPETESELGQLKAGDFFGETALLKQCKRGATVTASCDTEVLVLSREDFNTEFSDKKLNVQFAKRKAVSAEKAGASSTYTPSIPAGAVKAKDAATLKMILDAVKFNVLFMNLNREQQESVVGEMYKMEYGEGDTVIEQGKMGDNFYVVESGEFHVFVNSARVAVRQKGTCFGELALMYNSPRAATVTPVKASVVWVVDRFTFRRCVTGVSQTTLKEYRDFLSKVPVLLPLADYERTKIAEALEETNFGENAVVCKEGGDATDGMFIVKEGTLVVTKNGPTGEAEVGTLGPGDYFGERALIKNEPRAASVTTRGACVLLRLDRSAFSLLLGPLEDIMNKQINNYEEPPASPVVTTRSSAPKEEIKFDDLEVLGTLGKGSFGHVQLVKSRTTGTTYALKAVSKAQIVQTGQQGHIMSEKKAMDALDHPFLVKLHQTYKDQDRLYFLLEPSLGGELFSVLREKTLFDEDTSRFYSGHVVLAFEYMHSLNFVYRDLKPENLLLDEHGFLKVTDFGFAKDISGGRTWTLCGTPDYLAPEIVAGKGHSKGVDWWTLGVFIYEMLASYPPFYDEDPMKTYAKIMHGSITFPSHFSKEAVSIVKKLLYHKPTKRLGVVKGGAKLIKKHAWYKDFDWDKLVKREIKAPFVPNIKSDIDISNFDDYGDDEDEIQPYTDDGSNWDAEF